MFLSLIQQCVQKCILKAPSSRDRKYWAYHHLTALVGRQSDGNGACGASCPLLGTRHPKPSKYPCTLETEATLLPRSPCRNRRCPTLGSNQEERQTSATCAGTGFSSPKVLVDQCYGLMRNSKGCSGFARLHILLRSSPDHSDGGSLITKRSS